jgi:hypothetical protein
MLSGLCSDPISTGSTVGHGNVGAKLFGTLHTVRLTTSVTTVSYGPNLNVPFSFNL